MPIKWNAAFSVGQPTIDAHHKHIIKLMNSLQRAIRAGTDAALVPKILEDLSSYANFHFGAEENMFLQSAYPETEHHVCEHEEFRKNIDRLKELVKRKEIVEGSALLDFLSSWFIHHIVKTDMGMTPYIEKRKGEI